MRTRRTARGDHRRRRAAGVQVDAGTRPLHAGGHLGLVLAVAGHDEGHPVGQRLLDAAVAAVGHHGVDVGQQDVVGDEALEAHVGRQARAGAASGRARRWWRRRARPRRASARALSRSRRPRSALSSVPWVTWTTGRSSASSSHHGGGSNEVAGAAPGWARRSGRSARGPSAGTRTPRPSPASRRRRPWAGGR